MGTPTRTTGTREAVSAIVVVLALGLALRLIIAYALPGSGFRQDLDAFRFWASDLASHGPLGFYGRDFFADYTPGYLYVLWLVGIVGGFLGGVGDLIKLPPILADVALAWLVWSMAQELGASRRAALIGAAFVVANPVTWFDSVIWGQVDSFGVVFLLLALRELWRDRPERSAILTVIAAIIKPQLGILVPLVAVVTIRRAFWPTGGYGDERPPHGDEPPPVRDADDGDGENDATGAGRATTTAWEGRTRGWIRVVTTGAAGLATAIAVSLPFGLSLPGLVTQIFKTAGGYPYLSVNAYNPWALLSVGNSGIASDGTWVCDVVVRSTGAISIGPFTIVEAAARGAALPCAPPATAFMFGPVPALFVGVTLLLVAFVTVLAVVARRPDRRTMLIGLIVLALCFFVLPTRVHERYIYPLYALAAILVGVSVRWRIFYVLMALATFANMYVVLTTIYATNPNIRDWLGIGGAIHASSGVAVVVAIHLLGSIWMASQLTDGALGRLRDEIGQRLPGRSMLRRPAAGAESPVSSPGAAFAGALSADAAPPLMASPAAVAAPVTERYALPTWRDRPAWLEVGFWGWLRSRVFDRPVRPDRTASLAREPGGRLDRLDLWILVVLVVAVFGTRLWRLAEPYRMHFDEVYHARTATEFLQDWRYGISHEIYEYTHPHLAKYAMAVGLVAFGDDQVTGSSDLGVPIRDALAVQHWDCAGTGQGDRLEVATGSEIRSYDLRTRHFLSTVPIPGAAALALDPASHVLFVGTDSGELLAIDPPIVDPETGECIVPAEPTARSVAKLDGPIHLLHATDDGASLLAAAGADGLVMVDPETGTQRGRATLASIAAMDDAGTLPALVARPADVPDRAAAASTLAEVLGGNAADYSAALGTEADRVVIATVSASLPPRPSVDAAIADGRLAGFSIETTPRVAVADGDGISFVTPESGQVGQRMPIAGGAQGLARVEGIDDLKLYVAENPPTGPVVQVVTVSGASAANGATVFKTIAMPAPVGWVGYDYSSQQVHVLGRQPTTGGSGPFDRRGNGWTLYVIEPHANAVYADAPLPFKPVALTIDADEHFPAFDREQVFALDAAGTAVTVDAGNHAFAWRLPGVLAGTAMVAFLFLLTRILFRRRSVAVLVGILSLVDGMFFVQPRIGMNDVYVGLFIVAAYTLFAAIWTGWWRWKGAFWVAMPVIGLLLGLGLASKWVAAYAIGALGILVLARSALGRVLLIGVLILLTTVLGYMAVSVPAGQGSGNLTFMLIMIGLTLVAVVAAVLHPIAWSDDEVRFAVGAPGVAGIAVVLGALALDKADSTIRLAGVRVTPLETGFALVALSLAIAGAFWLVGRAGFGPLARPPDPDDPVRLLDPPAPPPQGWLRPGWAFGLPIAWTIACLLAIPIGVYVISYLPWAFVENHRLIPDFVVGKSTLLAAWPPGHNGQTLWDLTGQMYEYHNTLSQPHAASSPWWAWPFDLKPVWFYQQAFDDGTAASIYDAGNLSLWWLGVPALGFAAWQAFRRHSLALALLTIGFACQWISWARIDRAAFQYHYFTSLPFVVVALAYFLAELWHGASRHAWLLARVSAAAAVIGPAALWLFHRPLCGFVRVTDVNPNSLACPSLAQDFLLTGRTLALAVVVGLAVIMLVRQFLQLNQPERVGEYGEDRHGGGGGGGGAFASLAPLVGTLAGTLVALFLASTFFADVPVLTLHNIPVEPMALVVMVPLGALALAILTARDARRFVVGAVSAIIATFVVFYPNIAALPLPSALVNSYQGVLPTYLFPFQFPVSTVDRRVPGPPLLAPQPAILLLALVATCVIVGYSAWVWRLAIAERRDTDAADRPETAYPASGGT